LDPILGPYFLCFKTNDKSSLAYFELGVWHIIPIKSNSENWKGTTCVWTWRLNLEAMMNNQYQEYNFIHGWTMNVFVVWLTSWDWLIYLFATMDE